MIEKQARRSISKKKKKKRITSQFSSNQILFNKQRKPCSQGRDPPLPAKTRREERRDEETKKDEENSTHIFVADTHRPRVPGPV